ATVGINVDKVKAALGDLPMPKNGWDLLFKPEYASRIQSCGFSLLDSGDEVFPAALNYLGLPAESSNPADYAKAATLLSKIRPYVTLFSSSGYINELVSGALCVSFGWNGDLGLAARRAREAGNGQNIQTLIPKEGVMLFFDSMAIPADAEHVEEAYAWINYIYRPDVQAGIVNKVPYANPVRAADRYIRPDLLADKAVFIPEDQRASLIPPEPLDSDSRRLRTRLYTRFKVGQ
ncbi:MAG: extracellular solute-binding protein, partial [Paucibacter sp.]|nr:extracellular solute-binding protein [Roseateles sp.]